MSATRRTVLRGGAAALGITGARGALHAAGPDAELVRACAAYLDLERCLNEHPATLLVSIPADLEADQDRLIDEQGEVLDLLVLLPARTDAGRRTRARVLRAQLAYRVGPKRHGEDALAWAVLHDTLREEPRWQDAGEAS